MPRRIVLGLVIFALALAGCAQIAARDAMSQVKACLQAARATEDGRLVQTRLWVGDGSDQADKLTDTRPLTKAERDALVRLHNQVVPCRQIIVAHDNRHAAWETPYWQEFFQRSDAIYLKLVAGEIPVGVANRLFIESQGKFQTDVSRGHADAVRIEEAQRQRTAEAMMQASAQILAAQPRTTTTDTDCSWFGNTLNCTSRAR